MSKKYVYKAEYSEKNPNITHRRCSTCKEMKQVSKLENSVTCKSCYVSKYSKKRCKECSLLKPISEFYKNKTYKDNHSHLCKECTSIKYKDKQQQYSKKYYHKNKNSGN